MIRPVHCWAFTAALAGSVLSGAATDEAYLGWSSKQAEAIGTQAYKRGRVGGLWDGRLLKTERSYNYKLAATWLTSDVIRATARLIQLTSRLSPAETQALVAEAEAIPGTVIMIEIDPREGSGVIPSTWEAFLQPKGRPAGARRGTISAQLRDVKALAGVLRRNYDYDRFWVVFPLMTDDGTPMFGPGDATAELMVRIYDKEGHVEWTIPNEIRSVRKTALLHIDESVPAHGPVRSFAGFEIAGGLKTFALDYAAAHTR